MMSTSASFVTPSATKGIRTSTHASSCSLLLCSSFTPRSLRPVLRRVSRVARASDGGTDEGRDAGGSGGSGAARAVPYACAPLNVLSLADLEVSVAESLAEARESVTEAPNLRELDNLRVKYLGKKGSITAVMKSVGKLAPEERPKLGAVVNKAKNEVAGMVEERKHILQTEGEDDDDEPWMDLTMPGIKPHTRPGHIHPLTSTMEIATEIFRDIGYDLVDDEECNREIESDYYCFEALNCPPDHPARDMQDTFYLTEDKNTLLRTQTSSVQIRYMEQNKPPFKIIAPGRVYRRDTSDATHSAVFHQIEILAVDRFGVLNLGSLRATVIHFLKKMLGEDIETRFRASYFPFTEPSMEVDVFFRGKWLEVLGCGMVDPAVLTGVGLDPNEWCGFAAGFGVERFAMVMHEITDIREFLRNDPRFLRQFMPSLDGTLEKRRMPFGGEEDFDPEWTSHPEWDGPIFYNPDWGKDDDDEDIAAEDGNEDIAAEDGNEDIAAEDGNEDIAAEDGNEDIAQDGNEDVAKEDDDEDVSEDDDGEWIPLDIDAIPPDATANSLFEED